MPSHTKHDSRTLRRVFDDEPVFVLRARDPLAPAQLRSWADALEAEGGSPEKAAEARALADQMEVYREAEAGGGKLPD